MAGLEAIIGGMERQERLVLSFEFFTARLTDVKLANEEAAELIRISQDETDVHLQKTTPFLFKPLCENVRNERLDVRTLATLDPRAEFCPHFSTLRGFFRPLTCDSEKSVRTSETDISMSVAHTKKHVDMSASVSTDISTATLQRAVLIRQVLEKHGSTQKIMAVFDLSGCRIRGFREQLSGMRLMPNLSSP